MPRMAFESLLHYSVDDNPHMRDIVMYEENHYNGQMCTASDVNATDFVVKVAKDGVCVKNVHPDLWYVTLFFVFNSSLVTDFCQEKLFEYIYLMYKIQSTSLAHSLIHIFFPSFLSQGTFMIFPIGL